LEPLKDRTTSALRGSMMPLPLMSSWPAGVEGTVAVGVLVQAPQAPVPEAGSAVLSTVVFVAVAASTQG
jgi:hypothetical protein